MKGASPASTKRGTVPTLVPGRGDGVEARPLLRRERGTVSALVPAGNGHMNS